MNTRDIVFLGECQFLPILSFIKSEKSRHSPKVLSFTISSLAKIAEDVPIERQSV